MGVANPGVPMFGNFDVERGAATNHGDLYRRREFRVDSFGGERGESGGEGVKVGVKGLLLSFLQRYVRSKGFYNVSVFY